MASRFVLTPGKPRTLNRFRTTKDLYTVEVPCKDMDDPRHKTTTIKVPMILPHELLDYLIATWQCSVNYCMIIPRNFVLKHMVFSLGILVTTQHTCKFGLVGEQQDQRH